MRTKMTTAEFFAAPEELREPMARWLSDALWGHPNLGGMSISDAAEATSRLVERRYEGLMAPHANESSWLRLYDNFEVSAEGQFEYDKSCCGILKHRCIQVATPPPFMLWP